MQFENSFAGPQAFRLRGSEEGTCATRGRRRLRSQVQTNYYLRNKCSLFSVRLTPPFRSTDYSDPFKYNLFKNLPAKKA
jgi:hypothetical protein